MDEFSAAEEGRFGVRANCVGPGMLVDGNAERLIADGDLDDRALQAARDNTPLGRFGCATDVAEAVCFLAIPMPSTTTRGSTARWTTSCVGSARISSTSPDPCT